MRHGDLWETSVGRFTISWDGEFCRLTRRGTSQMTLDDLSDLQRCVMDAAHYFMQYAQGKDWIAAKLKDATT